MKNKELLHRNINDNKITKPNTAGSNTTNQSLKESETMNAAIDDNNKISKIQSQLIRYADDFNKTITKLNKMNTYLQESYIDTIEKLALAAEYKDDDTGDHIKRISRYSQLIAQKMGLTKSFINQIKFAAPMHDVGKIGIPDAILTKPGKLNNEEFNIIKSHTMIGAKILSNSKSDILQMAERIALSHHEKWNGKGYPNKISGEDIPICARIVAIADVFDALTHKRPYKEPYPVNVAYDIIKSEQGQTFDPEICQIFLNNIDEILQIKSDTMLHSNDEKIFHYSERDVIEGIHL